MLAAVAVANSAFGVAVASATTVAVAVAGDGVVGEGFNIVLDYYFGFNSSFYGSFGYYK